MTYGVPVETHLAVPINSDTAKLLEPTDYRANVIISMPETTQVKCKVCKGVTEHAFYIIEISNADVIAERKAMYVCINDGNVTISKIK